MAGEEDSQLNSSSTSISIAMEAQVGGWVGFGVGGEPTMIDIDTQVGMMAGGGVVVDGYSDGPNQPPMDTNNDNTNVAVKYENGILTAEFDRVLNTGQVKDNVWIAGSNSIVAAVNDGTPPEVDSEYSRHDEAVRFPVDFTTTSSCPPPPPPASPPPPSNSPVTTNSPTVSGSASAVPMMIPAVLAAIAAIVVAMA